MKEQVYVAKKLTLVQQPPPCPPKFATHSDRNHDRQETPVADVRFRVLGADKTHNVREYNWVLSKRVSQQSKKDNSPLQQSLCEWQDL